MITHQWAANGHVIVSNYTRGESEAGQGLIYFDADAQRVRQSCNMSFSISQEACQPIRVRPLLCGVDIISYNLIMGRLELAITAMLIVLTYFYLRPFTKGRKR